MNTQRLLIAVSASLILSSISLSAQTGAAFRQEGIASWYGAEYDGKTTASGEVFDSKLLTAAHPSLPFGTMLRVTNTQNGRMTIVRVNDRGPFVAARIVDVSKAAAEKLDIVATGTAPVVIETAEAAAVTAAAGPAEPPPAPAPEVLPLAETALPPAEVLPAPVDPASGKRYRIQVGSYKSPKYAAEAFEKVRKAGFAAGYEKNGEFYRVVVPEAAAADIGALAEKLGSAGFRSILAREIR